MIVPFDVRNRFDDLRRLAPNWDSYGAVPIDPAAIDKALAFIGGMEEGAVMPTIVPTVRGHVSLEWTRLDCEFSLEFGPKGALVFLTLDESEDLPSLYVEGAVG